MPRIRIVHIITSMSAGGAERMLCKLLTSLPTSDFVNSVISLKGGGELEPDIKRAAHRSESLNMKGPYPNPGALVRLWRIIREMEADVVQTWLYHADLLGYMAGRLAGVRAIAWNIRCSDMGEAYYRGRSGLVVRALAALSPRPEAIVVNSSAGCAAHKARGYRSKNWHVIPNGFDIEQFHPNLNTRSRVRNQIGIAEHVPLIGLVARFDPIKGHNIFLQAAEILSASHPECRFVLVGIGCEPTNSALTTLIPESLSDRVLLLGYRGDVAELTASLDVAVCASLNEGFPNTIGEAMACEVPCVVTDVGDCAEIIGDTGISVLPNNASEMANAWRKLLDQGDVSRRQLGAAARKRIQKFYSLPHIADIYGCLYRELAGRC